MIFFLLFFLFILFILCEFCFKLCFFSLLCLKILLNILYLADITCLVVNWLYFWGVVSNFNLFFVSNALFNDEGRKATQNGVIGPAARNLSCHEGLEALFQCLEQWKMKELSSFFHSFSLWAFFLTLLKGK